MSAIQFINDEINKTELQRRNAQYFLCKFPGVDDATRALQYQIIAEASRTLDSLRGLLQKLQSADFLAKG